MKITDDDGSIIETEFPTIKYQAYLTLFNIKKDEELRVENISSLFLTLRSDFLKGKLDLDEFANICSRLRSIMVNKKIQNNSRVLTETLNAGEELSFYIRKKTLLNLFIGFLQKVYDYDPSNLDTKVN